MSSPSVSADNKLNVPGNYEDNDPAPEGGFRLPDHVQQQPHCYINPAFLACFFDPALADNRATLWPWQTQIHENIADAKPTQANPHKMTLVAANGSGKDKFIIAPFIVWFMMCKIRSRSIVTSSSGTQLTAQTETYVKDLCNRVNAFHGRDVFKIRQRYIKCLDTGSECRMFATDEPGKAEGYHPIDVDSEMAIIENEAKSISEDIHNALRRCTGYNYWLMISSPGQKGGFFYKAATKWEHSYRITSYDCPNIPLSEIEADKEEMGEDSLLFRSKHLALFTSLDMQSIIPEELIDELVENPPPFDCPSLGDRVGIDLAAGGDETTLCFTRGNKVRREFWFREKDTVISAHKIHNILEGERISKSHALIFADDGGIGRSTIDILVSMGWQINRVMNQWTPASGNKAYGNRGAENWYRVKRLCEEKLINLSNISDKTKKQLSQRQYSQKNGAKIYLQPKREAKAEGQDSPDRADGLVLAFTGVSVEQCKKDQVVVDKRDPRHIPQHLPKSPREAAESLHDWYDDQIKFAESMGRKSYYDDGARRVNVRRGKFSLSHHLAGSRN